MGNVSITQKVCGALHQAVTAGNTHNLVALAGLLGDYLPHLIYPGTECHRVHIGSEYSRTSRVKRVHADPRSRGAQIAHLIAGEKISGLQINRSRAFAGGRCLPGGLEELFVRVVE